MPAGAWHGEGLSVYLPPPPTEPALLGEHALPVSPVGVKMLRGEEGGPEVGSGSSVGVCSARFGLCLLCALDKPLPLSEPSFLICKME